MGSDRGSQWHHLTTKPQEHTSKSITFVSTSVSQPLKAALGAAPTKSAATSHQLGQPGGQHVGIWGPFANQIAMSGNTGAHPPSAMNDLSESSGSLQGINSPIKLTDTYPTPLNKTRFDQSYRAYCNRKSLNINLSQLQIDNRPVDLYQLHRNVMLECGIAKVEQKGLWDVIGGRMGFVQFPATETEPAKSGPGVAQQLACIYKELLAAFDQYYVSSVLDARMKALEQRGPTQMNPSPQLMQSIITFAHVPTSELHHCGVPEKIIAFVEANRVNLQRAFADQTRHFYNRLRQTNQNDVQGSGDQMDNLAEHLANSLSLNTQQDPAASPAALAHQQQQQNALHLLQGNTFLGDRQPQHPQQALLQQGPPMQPTQPPKEYLEKVHQFVQNIKREINAMTIPSMPPVDVPVERRVDYFTSLDTLHARCLELEPKLAMYLVLFGKEEPIRRLATIICTVEQQKSFGGTRFIIAHDMVQKMLGEVKRMKDGMAAITQNALAGRPEGATSHSLSEVGGEASATADGPDH